MNIKVKILNPNAKIPVAKSEYAAGFDLFAASADNRSFFISPHETKFVNTGLAMEIPAGYFGAIFARSGLATREGLRPANCVGVIDSDYRGEIMIALYNDSNRGKVIAPGDRIAQLVILPCQQVTFEEADELDETERGAGGFGSTGK